MTLIEKELREALELMDGVSVAGRECRKNMVIAETKILAVANALREAEEKGEKHGGHQTLSGDDISD